jgi:hypothetical protein
MELPEKIKRLKARPRDFQRPSLQQILSQADIATLLPSSAAVFSMDPYSNADFVYRGMPNRQPATAAASPSRHHQGDHNTPRGKNRTSSMAARNDTSDQVNNQRSHSKGTPKKSSKAKDSHHSGRDASATYVKLLEEQVATVDMERDLLLTSLGLAQKDSKVAAALAKEQADRMQLHCDEEGQRAELVGNFIGQMQRVNVRLYHSPPPAIVAQTAQAYVSNDLRKIVKESSVEAAVRHEKTLEALSAVESGLRQITSTVSMWKMETAEAENGRMQAFANLLGSLAQQGRMETQSVYRTELLEFERRLDATQAKNNHNLVLRMEESLSHFHRQSVTAAEDLQSRTVSATLSSVLQELVQLDTGMKQGRLNSELKADALSADLASAVSKLQTEVNNSTQKLLSIVEPLHRAESAEMTALRDEMRSLSADRLPLLLERVQAEQKALVDPLQGLMKELSLKTDEVKGLLLNSSSAAKGPATSGPSSSHSSESSSADVHQEMKAIREELHGARGLLEEIRRATAGQGTSSPGVVPRSSKPLSEKVAQTDPVATPLDGRQQRIPSFQREQQLHLFYQEKLAEQAALQEKKTRLFLDSYALVDSLRKRTQATPPPLAPRATTGGGGGGGLFACCTKDDSVSGTKKANRREGSRSGSADMSSPQQSGDAVGSTQIINFPVYSPTNDLSVSGTPSGSSLPTVNLPPPVPAATASNSSSATGVGKHNSPSTQPVKGAVGAPSQHQPQFSASASPTNSTAGRFPAPEPSNTSEGTKPNASLQRSGSEPDEPVPQATAPDTRTALRVVPSFFGPLADSSPAESTNAASTGMSVPGLMPPPASAVAQPSTSAIPAVTTISVENSPKPNIGSNEIASSPPSQSGAGAPLQSSSAPVPAEGSTSKQLVAGGSDETSPSHSRRKSHVTLDSTKGVLEDVDEVPAATEVKIETSAKKKDKSPKAQGRKVSIVKDDDEDSDSSVSLSGLEDSSDEEESGVKVGGAAKRRQTLKPDSIPPPAPASTAWTQPATVAKSDSSAPTATSTKITADAKSTTKDKEKTKAAPKNSFDDDSDDESLAATFGAASSPVMNFSFQSRATPVQHSIPPPPATVAVGEQPPSEPLRLSSSRSIAGDRQLDSVPTSPQVGAVSPRTNQSANDFFSGIPEHPSRTKGLVPSTGGSSSSLHSGAGSGTAGKKPRSRLFAEIAGKSSSPGS